MRHWVAALALVLIAGSSHLLFGQAANKSGNAGILGYLDATTGAFRPIAQKALQTTAANVAPTTGTFVVNFAITIQSSFPANTTITCSVTANADNVSTNPVGSSVFIEQASTTAAISGASASCSVTIPYSWTLATPASDHVGLGYTITASTPAAAPIVALTTLRYSSQEIATIPVPASGTTTTQSVAATI